MPKEAKNDHILDDLKQLQAIKEILADTSSLIYLDKLSLIKLLTSEIKVMTISEVAREFGPSFTELSEISIVPSPLNQTDYANLDTDRKLLHQAAKNRIPLLSEDRRILRTGLEAGLQVHAAIMMVLLLYFRSRINLSDYERARDQLADWARYDRHLLSYADELSFMFGKFF